MKGDCYEVSEKEKVRSSAVRWAPEEIWQTSPYWVSDVMKCEKPYLAPGRIAWPCGQCASCRSTRRRVWSHRIMLEASQHVENSFVTLTYKEPRLDLEPDDVQAWLKRFRYFVSEWEESPRVRYFLCGEYGDRTGRPHYHAAVFGVGCRLGPVRVGTGGVRTCWCRTCVAVRDSWKLGHTLVGALEPRSAAYIAGYVLKKMNGTLDTTCRVPPFVRMSLKPYGIGAGALGRVVPTLTPAVLERMNNDVPVGLRIGGSVWPLGRYLRNHLRELLGMEVGCPQHVQEELKAKVSVVYEYADAVAKDNPRLWREAVRSAFEEVNRQENLNVAARNLKRGSL